MDDNFYIKVGKRYKPMGVLLRDRLCEGVWVVSKHHNSNETINADYMKDLFGVEKLENLQKLSLGELGSLHKLTEDVMQSFDFNEYFKESFTITDLVHKIVGLTYDKILEEQKKKSNK